MGSRYKDERLIDKVDELAASLHATSEVLSTADHMLDHYRDLNKDQDIEIARLNGELHATKRLPVARKRRGRSLSRTSSFSDVDERLPRSSRVRFTEDESSSEVDEFESALRNLSRKQNQLEKDLKRNQRVGTKELRGLGNSIRNESEETLLEKRLREIQQQLERDKRKKFNRDDSVEQLAEEIRQIKGLVQSRDTREPLTARSDMSNSRSYIEELQQERERSTRDQDTISDLRRQLRQKENDQENLTSQLRQTRGKLNESDTNQQQLKNRLEGLEEKLNKEKRGKQSLENELETFKDHTTRANRENAEMVSELKFLQSQTNRPDHQFLDLKRKYENLEREKEKAVDKLDSLKTENERKDILVERMTSQVRDLTSHVEKAESDKRKHVTELEDALNKLREYSRNLEEMKSFLRDREDELKSSEEKRQELKNRALEVVKDYRAKCRDLEKENTRLQERDEIQEKEMSRMRTEKRELDFGNKKSENIVNEMDAKIKQLEEDNKRLQNRLSQLNYEKSQLEQGLSFSNDAKKNLMKLQHELEDLNARNSVVSGQLAEETAKRRELEEKISEMKEKESVTKEENSNLYQQLHEERASHTQAMRGMEEELKAVSANEERTLKEITDKSNIDKLKYEDEIRSLKSELIDQRSLVKASEIYKNSNEDEIEKMNDEINRTVEENRRIRKKYQLMKKEFDEKLLKSERASSQHKERITELEDELRKNQEHLLQTRETFKQSLREIHFLVDSLLDGLMQEIDETTPIKSLSESIPLDPKKWSMEILVCVILLQTQINLFNIAISIKFAPLLTSLESLHFHLFWAILTKERYNLLKLC